MFHKNKYINIPFTELVQSKNITNEIMNEK